MEQCALKERRAEIKLLCCLQWESALVLMISMRIPDHTDRIIHQMKLAENITRITIQPPDKKKILLPSAASDGRFRRKIFFFRKLPC